MPLPRSAERERSRRRRRERTIERLRAELARARGEPEPVATPDEQEPERDQADIIAEWCADTLTVPTGLLAGQPFALEQWQVGWLRDALAPGVREAALCTPRKQGKTGLIAALLLCHLAGPLVRPRWRCIVVSLTGALAKELRRALVETAQASGIDHLIKDYATPVPGRIVGQNGAEVTILAADKATGHAVGVDLTVSDESGLLDEAKRPLWDAVYSSVSTRDGRNLHISIRGDSPMFAELRDRRDDPGIVWHEYAADEDADLLDESQWEKANPGLGSIKSINYMREAATRAATTPAAAPGFRSYDLNLPGSAESMMVVQVADYLRCVVDALPEREGPAILGLDLGGAAAFTAAACYWPRSGRCELYAGIGGIPDLAARGQADGVGPLYLRMHAGGELWTYPGQRETPIGDFVVDLREHLEGVQIGRIVADEYRGARLLDAMDAAGLVEWVRRLETRPVRWKQANDDVVAFQGSIIGRRVVFPQNLVLTQAIREARLEADTNGNVRLSKRRDLARIDVLTAAVLAVAEGSRTRDPKPAARYLGGLAG